MRPHFLGRDNSHQQEECGAQPKEDCGTGRNLPALVPRLKGTTGHPLEASKRSLPGEKFPVCSRSSPHTQGETDNPFSVPGLYYGPPQAAQKGVLNMLKPRCISEKWKIGKQWQFKEQRGIDWGLALLCAELGAPGSCHVTPACSHQAGRSWDQWDAGCATGALGTPHPQLCHHSATGFACLAASRRVRISFHCTNCLERSRVWA